jgi:putative ABC transport system permease protein
MTMLGLTLAGLRRRWLRTLVTSASVIITIAALTVTQSALRRVRRVVDGFAATSHVVLFPKDPEGSLPFAYVNQIKKIANADPDDWYVGVPANDGRGYRFTLNATSDRFPFIVPSSWVGMDAETGERWKSDPQGMIVGIRTIERFGWKVGDSVTVHSMIGDVRGRVSGIGRGYMPGHAIMHYSYIDQLLPEERRDRLEMIAVRVEPQHFGQVQRDIEAMFESSPDPVITVDGGEAMAMGIRPAAAVPELMARIELLMLLVTALISGSTLGMSLRERRSELATLRAIGFTRFRVARMVLFESLITALIGGAIGAGVPWLLYHHQGLNLGAWFLRDVTVDGEVCLLAMACAAALGVAVAILPALRASRDAVIDGLQS